MQHALLNKPNSTMVTNENKNIWNQPALMQHAPLIKKTSTVKKYQTHSISSCTLNEQPCTMFGKIILGKVYSCNESTRRKDKISSVTYSSNLI